MPEGVLIIGGGPAGMMAGIWALRAGAPVTLLEKNEKLGKKLYITGKGRCNVSNAAEGEEFLRHVPRNPRFLYAALKRLSPSALRDLLSELGCETVVERGQRVFPVSQKASDVIRTLTRALEGADIRLHTQVQSLCPIEGGWAVTLQDGRVLKAGAVVIATGGLSYPMTGSTGDGYGWAKELGHGIQPQHAALVPLETKEPWVPMLQGLTLKNVRLTATLAGKQVFDEQGEMLFAHFGITGPLVLSLSSALAGHDLKAVKAGIDMKPALSEQQLQDRLQRMLLAGGRKQVKSLLSELLPGKMVEAFPQICPMDWSKLCSQVTAAERQRIVSALKYIPLTITALRPIREAVITRGGVDTKSVNPSTMMSRLCPGLFFAGEVLDVDALTGGYNLQIAFATGTVAGEQAVSYLKKE